MKVRDFILPVLCIVVVAVFYPIQIVGNSMFPTLKDGEIGICTRISNISRFDIVVVNQDGKKIIKRVIGLPNETIEYKDNQLYINNSLVKDSKKVGFTKDFKVKLGSDEYFCMGDNREHSLDSRKYGAYSRKQIMGEKIL